MLDSYLGQRWDNLYKWFNGKGKTYSLAFTRWDEQKWFEITYRTEAIGRSIFFDLYIGWDLIASGFEKMSYEIKAAVYYETSDISRRCLH